MGCLVNKHVNIFMRLINFSHIYGILCTAITWKFSIIYIIGSCLRFLHSSQFNINACSILIFSFMRVANLEALL